MSISIEHFDKGSLPVPRHLVNKEHPVYKFLSSHNDEAFRSGEIATAIGFSESNVRGLLAKMKKSRLVRRKAIGRHVYFTSK